MTQPINEPLPSQVDDFLKYVQALDAPTSWGPIDYQCIKHECASLVSPQDPDKALCHTHLEKLIKQLRDDLMYAAEQLAKYEGVIL